MTRRPLFSFALLGLVTVFACRPASVTEARDQLGRGGDRGFGVTLPITNDTITVIEFIEDSLLSTTRAGVAGVVAESESTAVSVGDQLDFTGIGFDPYTFSYDQMLVTQEISTSLAATTPPPGGAGLAAPPVTVLFDTPDGSDVVGGTVQSGWVVRTVTNSTDCDATVSGVLTDQAGDTLGVFPGLPVNQGGSATDSLATDGASFSQSVDVDAAADFGLCVPTGGTANVDVTFRPMTLASVDLQNVNETFTDTHAVLASESRLQAVDTVVVDTGSFTATVQNRLPVAITVDVRLDGVLVGGAVPVRSVTVPAAPGDGSLTSGPVTFDLAGATILPPIVNAVIDGAATAGAATVTPATATDAVVVDGGGALTAAVLAGGLDPAQTPELTVSVENSEEFDRDAFDFGDLEDAVRDATINDADLRLTLTNTSGAPVVLTGFTLGVVELDAGGNVPRDGSGNPVYETDSLGAALLLPVTEPGQSTLSLERSGTSEVILDAGPLMDRLVTLVLSDRRAAVVAAGTAVAGDGLPSRVTAQDEVAVTIDVTVGLDVTLPDSGVTFTRNTIFDGLDFDPADADEIQQRVEMASIRSDVENGTPFAVTVDIALAEGDLGETDVFAIPGHVALLPVTVAAPAVDAQGLVVAPATDGVTVSLSGDQLRPLLGSIVTATVRVRIGPSPSGPGRAALRTEDPVVVRARAETAIRAGGQ